MSSHSVDNIESPHTYHLACQGIEDQRRRFAAGSEVGPVAIAGVRSAVMVCLVADSAGTFGLCSSPSRLSFPPRFQNTLKIFGIFGAASGQANPSLPKFTGLSNVSRYSCLCETASTLR